MFNCHNFLLLPLKLFHTLILWGLKDATIAVIISFILVFAVIDAHVDVFSGLLCSHIVTIVKLWFRRACILMLLLCRVRQPEQILMLPFLISIKISLLIMIIRVIKFA